jgi:hypothetical protein
MTVFGAEVTTAEVYPEQHSQLRQQDEVEPDHVKLRDQTRRDLGEAHERAARAERDRDVAQQQAEQRIDRDG